MRSIFRLASSLWCAAVACSASTGMSQTSQNAGVALIDLGVLMEGNRRFVEAMESVADDTLQLEQQVRREHAQLQRRLRRLQDLEAGSSAWRREEKAIADAKSALQSRAALDKSRLLRRETQVYAECYGELQVELEAYCRQHGIALVLRYDSRPVEWSEGAALRDGLQRTVVYQSQRDITLPLLQIVNARRGPRYGQLPLAERVPKPLRFLGTVPETAAKRVVMARAAWALNDLVSPPAS